MSEKKWKKLSNETLYAIRLSQVTSEQYEEAKNFPLDTLLAFAFNKMDDAQKADVQKKFWENYCLFDRYLKIEYDIEEEKLESIGEYKVYLAKENEEHHKEYERRKKYRELHEKNGYRPS